MHIARHAMQLTEPPGRLAFIHEASTERLGMRMAPATIEARSGIFCQKGFPTASSCVRAHSDSRRRTVTGRSRSRFSGGSTAPARVSSYIPMCSGVQTGPDYRSTLQRGLVRSYHAAISMMPNGYMRSCAGRGAKAVESRLRP